MKPFSGKVAWVTGAGSGIGAAVAIALAREGAKVVLSGRRKDALEQTAAQIGANGGDALVAAGDLGDAKRAAEIATVIEGLGRLDVVVNAAGANIAERRWSQLQPAGIQELINANLSAAFYVTQTALPIMRSRQDGLFVHIGSWVAHFPSTLAGPVYTATKSAVVAMSHTLNMEEGTNGIRSCVLSPGEVVTPIMDKRPVPPSAAERAQMLQPEDVADLVVHLAGLPARVCVNEIIVSPTKSRLHH